MSTFCEFVPAWQRRCAPAKANWWEAFSPKLGRAVRLYGNLTYYLWIWIETSPAWESFCEHPEMPENNPDRRIPSEYVMWARSNCGAQVFFRVKYASYADDEDDARYQINGLGGGFAYAVATDRLLFAHTLEVSNWVALLRFGSYLPANYIDLRGEIMEMVKAAGGATIADIEAKFSMLPIEDVRAALFGAIRTGQLKVDLRHEQLNREMLVTYVHQSS